MTDTPCKCENHNEMQLHSTKIKLVQSITPAIACENCRVITWAAHS